MGTKIRLFYDVVSPYSWIAFEHLIKLRDGPWKTLVSIELEPFFLGGVMKNAENVPPGSNPRKAMYMGKYDLPRLSRLHRLPLTQPKIFPLNTLKAQRCLAHIRHSSSEEVLIAASRALWNEYWGGGKNGGDLSNEATLAIVLGQSEETIRQWTQGGQEKKWLEEATGQALQAGAYGAPFMLISKPGGQDVEPFFGSDRFELIAYVFGLPNPTAASLQSKL